MLCYIVHGKKLTLQYFSFVFYNIQSSRCSKKCIWSHVRALYIRVRHSALSRYVNTFLYSLLAVKFMRVVCACPTKTCSVFSPLISGASRVFLAVIRFSIIGSFIAPRHTNTCMGAPATGNDALRGSGRRVAQHLLVIPTGGWGSVGYSFPFPLRSTLLPL